MAPCPSLFASKSWRTVCPARWCECAILNQGVNCVERYKMNKRFSLLCRIGVFAALANLSHPIRLPADSLWREDASSSMIGDKRAHGVGDILTIIVQENSSTTK